VTACADGDFERIHSVLGEHGFAGAALHEGFNFDPDVSAHFDPSYRKVLSCKPSPFETEIPASVDCP
jgi:hypothetical protein